MAILGDTAGTAPVLRSGAGPGETVFVTGPLGAASAGLRELRADPSAQSACTAAFLRPVPRLGEGVAAALGGARAMIDVSDGFGIDLRRLAEASGVGVALDELPVAPGATADEALGGGEDYELVFTTPDPGASRGALRRIRPAGAGPGRHDDGGQGGVLSAGGAVGLDRLRAPAGLIADAATSRRRGCGRGGATRRAWAGGDGSP